MLTSMRIMLFLFLIVASCVKKTDNANSEVSDADSNNKVTIKDCYDSEEGVIEILVSSLDRASQELHIAVSDTIYSRLPTLDQQYSFSFEYNDRMLTVVNGVPKDLKGEVLLFEMKLFETTPVRIEVVVQDVFLDYSELISDSYRIKSGAAVNLEGIIDANTCTLTVNETSIIEY